MCKGKNKEEEDRNTMKNFSHLSGIKYLKIHDLNIRQQKSKMAQF